MLFKLPFCCDLFSKSDIVAAFKSGFVMSIEQRVLDSLKSVKCPFINQNAYEMNLHASIESTAKSLELKLISGFPCAPLETEYKALLLAQLGKEFPDHEITLSITQQIKAHKTQLVGKGLRGIKNTIAVASGKGGVGKSTVTVNLATALARLGAKVGILDADIYGPSIPMMLGKTDPVQLSGDHYLPVKAHGIEAMSIGYLTQGDQALIWRGPMLAKSLVQMLDITLWNDLDYLFIDLPPGTGDIQLTLVQKIPLTAAIVVTTPQNIATLDAEKALNMFDKTNIDVLGVIENMSTHLCSHCGHQEAIFGEGGAQVLCTNHSTLLLGQLPLDARIRQQGDEGTPIGGSDSLSKIWTKAALQVAVELAKKPLNYADKFPDIVIE